MADTITQPSHYDDYNFIIRTMGGAARSNHFSFDLEIPDAVITRMNAQLGINYTKGQINELLEYFCQSISLNAIPEVNAVDVKTYGEPRNFSIGASYNTISVAFLCDVEGIIYNLFSAWKNCMYSLDYRIIGWYDNYTSPKMTIRLTKEYSGKKQGKIGFRSADEIITVVCDEVFPTTIDPLAVNGETSQNLLIQVLFKSKTVEVVKGDGRRNAIIRSIPSKTTTKASAPVVTKPTPIIEIPETETSPTPMDFTFDKGTVPTEVKWERVAGGDEYDDDVWIAKISVNGGEYIVTDAKVSDSELRTTGFPKIETKNLGEDAKKAIEDELDSDAKD